MKTLAIAFVAAFLAACASIGPAHAPRAAAPDTTQLGSGPASDKGNAIAESLGYHGPTRRFSSPPDEAR